jgi:nitronate monooxygenase
MWDGPVVLAGGISDGRALAAARVLGCDLGYMGTRFIATVESMATPEYKEMLVASSLDDVMLTRAFTGLETNMLRPSIVAAGLDPEALPERGGIDVSKDISRGEREEARRWRDIWSAGHSVSGVCGVMRVADLVAATADEYWAAME